MFIMVDIRRVCVRVRTLLVKETGTEMEGGRGMICSADENTPLMTVYMQFCCEIVGIDWEI